jgi:hypothetical protein
MFSDWGRGVKYSELNNALTSYNMPSAHFIITLRPGVPH